jgi:hypothetical protein
MIRPEYRHGATTKTAVRFSRAAVLFEERNFAAA